MYGQNEVVKDLIVARCSTGRPLFFEVADVSVHDLEDLGIYDVHQNCDIFIIGPAEASSLRLIAAEPAR